MTPPGARNGTRGRRPARQPEHVLSRRFYEWGARKGLAGAPTGAARLDHLLARVRDRYAFAFEREAAAFDACLDGLRTARFATDEEMVTVVAARVCAFANATFTREELEARYDQPEARVDGGIELNCVLECQPNGRNPSVLKLHLRPTSRLSAATLREAFTILADKVGHEDRFHGIETIWLTSWIVVEHPGLIERLGFTRRPARATGVGHASMSRETLLNRYARKDVTGRRGVVAVIPARAGSKRIPGKNVCDFLGQPLVVWSVRAAMASRLADRIVVSTDDPRVVAALAPFPVGVIDRPPHLATDAASTRDALRHADAVLGGAASEPELMVVPQPTSPLREADLIDSGIQRMRESPSADRLVEVTHRRLFTGHIVDGWWQPDFPDGTRSQELPSLWYPTGRLYVVRCAALDAESAAERCLAHPGRPERWNNIDDEEDLLWARMIYQRFEPDYAHLRAPLARQ